MVTYQTKKLQISGLALCVLFLECSLLASQVDASRPKRSVGNNVRHFRIEENIKRGEIIDQKSQANAIANIDVSLVRAAVYRGKEMIEKDIEKMDLEARDQQGRSKLMLATVLRKHALISQLLAEGAAPDVVDNQGNNVIAYAVGAGSLVALRTITSYMSRPDKVLVKNKHQRDAHDLALAYRHDDPATFSAKILDYLGHYKEQLKN